MFPRYPHRPRTRSAHMIPPVLQLIRYPNWARQRPPGRRISSRKTQLPPEIFRILTVLDLIQATAAPARAPDPHPGRRNCCRKSPAPAHNAHPSAGGRLHAHPRTRPRQWLPTPRPDKVFNALCPMPRVPKNAKKIPRSTAAARAPDLIQEDAAAAGDLPDPGRAGSPPGRAGGRQGAGSHPGRRSCCR